MDKETLWNNLIYCEEPSFMLKFLKELNNDTSRPDILNLVLARALMYEHFSVIRELFKFDIWNYEQIYSTIHRSVDSDKILKFLNKHPKFKNIKQQYDNNENPKI